MLSSFVYSEQYKVPASINFDSVIILIGDGLTTTGKTITRLYKQDYLIMDSMYRSEFRTNSSDSLITDSAAAATAFASGCKIVSEMLGILSPKKNEFSSIFHSVNETRCIVEFEKPAVTILEAAKLKGKSVGLVSTSEVQHATPAGFSAHISDRDDMAQIAKQQVYQDLDVVLGGGKKYLLPKSAGGVREENDDLTIVLKERGYLLINRLSELNEKNVDKVWGLFAPEDLDFEMDRNELNPEQPTLKEMTETAINLLSINHNGFFLMVEGSKIDWAAHDNDPVGIISDTLSFDDAVKTALEFAEKDGHTLVLVLSDHGTGGISIGNKSGGKVPYHISYDEVFKPLKNARLTSEGVAKLIKDSACDVHKATVIIEKYYGIGELFPEQLYVIRKCNDEIIRKLLGQIISEKSNIGWTTTAHTGEDQILYSNIPIERNAKNKNLFDNTEIAHVTDELLNLDLSGADDWLYVDAGKAFEELGAEMTIEKVKSDKDIKIVVTKKYKDKLLRMVLPVNTDICILESDGILKSSLKGITIYLTDSSKGYVSFDAIEKFKEMITINPD